MEEKDYELQQEELEKQKEELKKKIRFYNIYGLQGYVSENFDKNKNSIGMWGIIPMEKKKKLFEYMGIGIPIILGLFCIIIVCSDNQQALLPTPMPQSFIGEYSYDGTQWMELSSDTKLSALKGEVWLRGHLERNMSEGWLLSFYRNHIGISMYVNDKLIYVDAITQLSGKGVNLFSSMCGQEWSEIVCPEITTNDKVEFRLMNPHKYGNKAAYNEFLATLCGNMSNADFLQKKLREYSEPFLAYGIFLLVAAVLILGTSVAAAITKNPVSNHLLKFGFMTLFAGGYSVLDIIDISYMFDVIVFNTYTKIICMMLAVYFLEQFLCNEFTGKVKKVGQVSVLLSGIINSGIIIASFAGLAVIFDMFPIWVLSQFCFCSALVVCCLKTYHSIKEKRITCLLSVMMLLSVLLDLLGVGVSVLSRGTCSKVVFLFFFVLYIVIGAKKILDNHHASIRAAKLEKELEENRIAIMLSQIQPHFLYNALGTIRGLCRKNPEQAWEAIGDFSKYLRGNMSSLTNKEKIFFSTELNHIEAYLRLEKVRIGDRLNILYDIQEKDFLIPPLTIQPLVENAIKHGLFDKAEGGTLILHTRREDDKIIITVKDNGLGFEESAPFSKDDHHTHIGLNNVRTRLKKMMNGQLVVNSIPGEGTVATVILSADQKEVGS